MCMLGFCVYVLPATACVGLCVRASCYCLQGLSVDSSNKDGVLDKTVRQFMTENGERHEDQAGSRLRPRAGFSFNWSHVFP